MEHLTLQMLVVFVGLLANIGLYCFVSMRYGSWVGPITAWFAIEIPAVFIFELAYLSMATNPGSVLGYVVIYSAYFLFALSFVLVYAYSSVPSALVKSFRFRPATKLAAATLLFVAVFLYLPIFKLLAQNGFSPRDVYVVTRTGFGLAYFGSILAANLFLVVMLFLPVSRWLKTVSFVFCVFFAYLHGSKGHVFVCFFILLQYFWAVRGLRIGIGRFSLFGLIAVVVAVGLFFLMAKGVEFNQIISLMVGYSDYARNAVMLVDSLKDFHYGGVFLEDNLYTRLPRLLFESKPKDFGAFGLAKQFFPDSFYLDQGVPSFGLGVFYADFWIFILPVLGIAGAWSGFFAKVFFSRVRVYKSPSDFVMLCFFCGIGFIPVGGGYLLFEHFFLAVALFALSSISALRIMPKRFLR